MNRAASGSPPTGHPPTRTGRDAGRLARRQARRQARRLARAQARRVSRQLVMLVAFAIVGIASLAWWRAAPPSGVLEASAAPRGLPPPVEPAPVPRRWEAAATPTTPRGDTSAALAGPGLRHPQVPGWTPLPSRPSAQPAWAPAESPAWPAIAAMPPPMQGPDTPQAAVDPARLQLYREREQQLMAAWMAMPPAMRDPQALETELQQLRQELLGG